MVKDKFNRKLEFVTFGGLNLTKQKGYKELDTYHAPPAVSGIYAFVWPYIERFLLGGDEFINPKKRGKGQRQRMVWVRDGKGNIIDSKHSEFSKRIDRGTSAWTLKTEETDNEEEPYIWALYQNAYRKKFVYDGNLWHHLTVPEFSIIDRKGSWVKTDMAAYKVALKKEIHGMLNSTRKWQGHTDLPKSVKFSAKDHLEVFIDEKI